MTTFLLIVILILGGALAVFYFLKQRAERMLAATKEEAEAAWKQRDYAVARAREETQAAIANTQAAYEQKCAELDSTASRLREQAEAAVVNTQAAFEQKCAELDVSASRIREHYESEARKTIDEVNNRLAEAFSELETLRRFASLKGAEEEVNKTLADALTEATALRQDALRLLEQTRNSAEDERRQAQQRAKETAEQAESVLTQATRDAGRIVTEAERRAEEIGGDAYIALRDKQLLEHAARAIRNVVEGYGDRYVIPTHSLLDDLAADFGHTAAGEALKSARDQSRRMAGNGEAAACDYSEANRRETAIRFVIDAFNGRVDAILSTVRHNNYGTLEQQIRDAFALVNLNGQAFRNARILPAYLDSRLRELKWAVLTQEMKLKEREEQREIQERIREEEKARRDYERAMQEAAQEEATIKRAMEKARAEAQHATAQERSKLEAQLVELSQRLAEAEAKNQRALSMAQQTRSGHVYIISNVGSFGDEVFKIGMTRRLEPLDRVRELGDASVPFAFDVHAMIHSEDAPTLERILQNKFRDMQINKMNNRKEFFRLPLERIRAFAAEKGLDVTFTMAAEAREYRETLALERMTPAEREKYRLRDADWREVAEE